MSVTTNRKILITAGPFCWIHLIDSGAVTELYAFDNIKSHPFGLPLPSEDSEGDNVDIERAEGGIIRFTKNQPIISGEDETEKTDPSKDADATAKGTITVVSNEAPVQSTINSPAAFLQDLNEKRLAGNKYIITTSVGYTYYSRNTGIGSTPKKQPDGWFRMVGKFGKGIDMAMDANPQSFSLEFLSYKDTTIDSADIEGMTYTELTHKLGGAGKDITGITPPALASPADDTLISNLLNGIPIITPVSATQYSWT